MDLSAKVKRSAICAGVSVVRSARFGSFSSLQCGLYSGVDRKLVNSDSTSKDTMISLSKVVSLLMVDMKWAELVTVYSDFPVKVDRMLAK